MEELSQKFTFDVAQNKKADEIWQKAKQAPY